MVNGQPGLAAQQDAVIVMAFGFDVADDRITHVWAIHNPESAGRVLLDCVSGFGCLW